MPVTPYSLENRAFSDRAATCARRDVYPKVFSVTREKLRFIRPTIEQDTTYGIDVIVEVTTPNLRPMRFKIAERFRRPGIARYGDVTISEFLENSQRSSELYNTEAQLFMFGRYDEQADRMIESLVFWVHPVRFALASGHLPFARGLNPAQNKHFIAIKIAALKQRDLIAFYQHTPIPELAGIPA